MIIAVDFDGTIVEHRYPKIGKEIPFAIQTLRTLIKEGHQLILWSVREGALLQEALDWCHERGVDFYAANMDEPVTDTQERNRNYSRKIKADLFIDDRNLGGLPRLGTHLRHDPQREDLSRTTSPPLPRPGEEDEPQPKKRWWKF